MDAYTAQTRDWLEERYARTAADGVYVAHQPIYGFRAGHCEPWLQEKYARTLAIMRALARVEWESLLDVGAAEGYKAAMAERLFGGRAMATDLSEEACLRAKEIFGVDGRAADVHDLPFGDGQFDVVVCSETLEHVTDLAAATRELARVARNALIITVPNDPVDEVEHQREAGAVHAHIHKLDARSFDFLSRESGYGVTCQPICSPIPRIASGLIEGQRKPIPPDTPPGRRAGLVAFNTLVSPLSRALGERTEEFLVGADRFACRLFRRHAAFLFVVLKQPGHAVHARRAVGPRDVVRFTVPLHRPRVAA